MSSQLMTPIQCPKCTAPRGKFDHFCSQCGTSFDEVPRPRRLRWICISAAASFAVCLACIYGTAAIQSANGSGKKPLVSPHRVNPETEVPDLSDSALSANPELSGLLQKARSAPKDTEAWSSIGGALLDILSASPGSSEIQLDALDVFAYVLSLEPKDTGALRAMGDLCFDQRLFQKSLFYYERYLALIPEDNEARARRASTLTFLGRAAEAVTELEAISKNVPEAFQPLAFLAIALSQKGDIAEAHAVGQRALAKAPSDEARERFGAFLKSLPQPSSEAGPSTQQKASVQNEASPSWLHSVETLIRGNPIAGSKFTSVRFNTTSKVLTLSFSNFPMEGMPDFAKTKFTNSIRTAIASAEVASIEFIDDDSKRVMHKETL